MEKVKATYADLFLRLKTDYVDVGMIHYVDEQKDFDQVFQGPVLSRTDPERLALYSLCESENIALTVMKPYGGGALLDAGESPFGIAMTAAQCLYYCLTRPAVACVLAGARTEEELSDKAVLYQKAGAL